MPEITFNPKTQKAVLKCSICNGEQVAGFKDIETGATENNLGYIKGITQDGIPYEAELFREEDSRSIAVIMPMVFEKTVRKTHVSNKSKEVKNYLATKSEGGFVFVFTPRHGSCSLHRHYQQK